MKISLISLLLFFLAGCSASTVGHQITTTGEGLAAYPVQVPNPYEPINPRAFDNYVNGLLFEEIGDFQNAARSFERAWSYQPESVEIGLAYSRSLFQLRNYTGALDALKRLGEDNAEVLELKGLCYRRLGDVERGRQQYLQLIRIDSTNDMAFMFLADFYRRRQDLDSSVWALKHLQRIMPDRHEIPNELGIMFISRGDLAQARESFHRSLELLPAPANADAMTRLAGLYLQAGEVDSMLLLLEGALERQPNNAVVNKELAEFWIARDSAEAALPYLRNVAEIDPGDTDGRRRLALTYMAIDSLGAADSILSDLVEAGDGDPTNHFYMGRIAIIQKDFYRARDELKIVTRDAAAFPDAWMALGFVYRQLDKPDEEIETYRSGLMNMRDEEDAIQLYFSLGAAYEQAGEVDSAVAVFEDLLAHHPDHSPSLNYLGYTLADRGERLEYARELIQRAVEMQPQNAAYLDSYGWVCYRLGLYDEAIEHLSAAASLDSDPVIYDHLGDAYKANGDNDKAREWWEKAREQKPDDESILNKLGH